MKLRINKKKIAALAKDLTIEFARSPRDTLAGYVIACRTLDKCRALLNGTLGDYHSGHNCPLDRFFLDFAGISANDFKKFVATGASDKEVAAWIKKNAKQKSLSEIVVWNNKMRETRLSDRPLATQLYLEDYIAKNLPPNRPIYYWFDVYDIEEKRI